MELVVILGMFARSNRCILINRSSSKTLEIYRIWHLKCFNNLVSSSFFFKWQWNMSAPGITNLLQRRWWVLKKLHMNFTFFVAKVSHWGRKCSCLNCWQYTILIRQSGYKREWLQNFDNIRQDSPSKSYFIEKVCWIH